MSIAAPAAQPQRAPDAVGRIPPGPRGYPLLGMVPEVIRQGGALLPVAIDVWREFGDVAQFRLGPFTFVQSVRPDAAKRILVDNRDNYPRSRLQMWQLGAFLGSGLLASEGAHWRRQRHFMQGPFAPTSVLAYTPAMAAAARDLVAAWAERLRTGRPEVEVLGEMVPLTMDVLGRTMLGFDTRADAEAVGQDFMDVLDYVGRHAQNPMQLPGWLPTPGNRRFKRAVRRLDSVIYEVVRTRRADPDTYGYASDMLSLILRARDDWGEGMLEQHLRDELMTLYFAGHETTALALTWTFYLLSQNPEAERRLHGEVDEVLNGREATEEDVERLEYTGLVVQEALRLYPPAPMIVKDVREDDIVEGYRVPRGVSVLLNPFITQRHPEFWPDPERFDPERHAPEQAQARHRFAWLPFSGGSHSCIGAAFALQEAKLALATIARHYRLTLVPGHPVEPVQRLTLRPKSGVHMRLEPRR